MPSSLAVIAVVLAVTATSTAAGGGAPWSWPVDGDRTILRPFVAPATPYGPGHRGVDLLATGDALAAPADGVVRFAGMVAGRPVLSIDHGDGVISSYEPVVATVIAGDGVVRGELLGTIQAGHCPQRCVHLGVRVDGEYANPLQWLGGGIRPILLPTRFPVSSGTGSTGPRTAGSPVSGRVGLRRRPRARAPATRTAPP